MFKKLPFIRVIILYVFLFHMNQVAAQECNFSIPNQNWKGTTTINKNYAKANSDNVNIVKVGTRSYQVSDFSAGLFKSLGFNEDTKVILEFNCDGSIISKQEETKFGICEFSGFWNDDKNTLIIKWKIPFNEINETSLFILK
jgi:hypothetical protein